MERKQGVVNMADPLRPGRPPVDPGLLGELQSEVAAEAAPLLSFVLRHIRIIAGAVVALVLFIIGYGVWQWRLSSAENEASLALGRILTGQSGSAQAAALEALAEQVPASMRQGVLLAAASSAAAAGEPDRAAAVYGKVYAADPEGALGVISGLNEAALLRQGGKVKDALAVLEKLEAAAPQAARVLVREELAAAAEQAGEKSRALQAYEALVQDLSVAPVPGLDPGFYRDRIKQLKARGSDAS